jgi:hypothetical protein
VEDIMARKQNDDLLIEDELAAAFLNDDDLTSTTQTSNAAPASDDSWEEADDDFPGQLAVDVYETADTLVVKARTAGVNKEDLDVSISDGILTVSGTLSSGDDTDASCPGKSSSASSQESSDAGAAFDVWVVLVRSSSLRNAAASSSSIKRSSFCLRAMISSTFL